MRLETALAGASLTKVERRDPYKMKHKMTPVELQTMAPGLAWKAYLAELRVPAFGTANVTAPAFFIEVSTRLSSEPLGLWKDYLRFHLANGRAPYLSAPFVMEDFEFYRKYLKGAKEIQPRWKRCVRLVDDQLGEALGQTFVRKVFTPPTNRILAMAQRIESAMERRLQARDWMSAGTKTAALAKLHAIHNKIGYPDTWRDYSAVRVERGDFFGDVRRAASFEFDRQLGKIGKPVDHGEWDMTPPTVNADYDSQMNDMTFPAGVLQPPLYDSTMDDAPNYGNTGGTIGHELTHGFDDEGRQYDAHGNLRDWWTKEDAAKFAARSQCVADQYGAYVAIDDIKVNSALTLGEDVADLGGEILAYEAWKDAVKGGALADRNGLTPDRRFFVGFGQWACENARPEQQWLALCGAAPPPGLSRSMMIWALADRMQERALGGLKPATRRFLRRFPDDVKVGRPAPPPGAVPPGAVLVREWHGTSHQVAVLETGCTWQGRRYRSLSEVARKITGTRWSGPRFFGLERAREDRHDGTD